MSYYPQAPYPQQTPPQQKSKLPLVLGLVAGALALLCVVGIVVGSFLLRPTLADEHKRADVSTGNVQANPESPTVGKSDAPVVLDVYEDFMCPACALFEARYGDQLAQATAGGKLQVQYHMLNFLNRNSASGDYSSRAAGAALAVFQKAPDAFPAFHAKLFAQGTQPQEGAATDLTNEQLAQIAEHVGAGAASADIRSGADVQAAAALARDAQRQLAAITGSVSTPSIIEDGKAVQWQDPQWLAGLLG